MLHILIGHFLKHIYITKIVININFTQNWLFTVDKFIVFEFFFKSFVSTFKNVWLACMSGSDLWTPRIETVRPHHFQIEL